MSKVQPVPPHSFEAESAVVGGLILAGGSSEILAECVSTGLVPDDFFTTKLRESYGTILEMASEGKPIDLITLKNELTSRNIFDAKWTIEQLAATVETCPTAAHAPSYARIVQRKAVERHLLRLHGEIGKKLVAGEELNGELDEIVEIVKRREKTEAEQLPRFRPAVEVLQNVSDDVVFILEPILAEGCLTQLQGDPKAGKSCLSELIGMACAAGRWTAGRWEFHGQPRRVGYLSYEDNLRRLKHRARQYIGGLGLGQLPPNFVLLDENPFIDLTTREGYQILKTYLERDQIEVLIIDTLSYIHSAEENSKKEMQPVMAHLRRLIKEFPKVSILLIHHTNKSANQDSSSNVARKGRGSSAIAAAYDIILDFGNRIYTNTTACALASKEKPGSDEFVIVYKPQDDGSVLWSLENNEGTPAVKAKKEKILEVLAELEKTSPEGVLFATISSSMPDIPRKTVQNNLSLLTEEGRVELIRGVGPRNANAYRRVLK